MNKLSEILYLPLNLIEQHLAVRGQQFGHLAIDLVLGEVA